jgi:hypothetical protein
MTRFTWTQSDNEYRSPAAYGVAIIIENSPGYFEARLESPSGARLAGIPEILVDFTEIEALLHFQEAELELSEDSPRALETLYATLDWCTALLPPGMHPVHALRIEHIKRWYSDHETYRHTASELTRNAPASLTWTGEGPEYTAVTPHGQAVIEELPPVRSPFRFGGASSYAARIEHPTGAALHCPANVNSFEDADRWVRETLAVLNSPVVDEPNLDALHFTLAICARVLPEDADPIYAARLEYLEMRLDDALM